MTTINRLRPQPIPVGFSDPRDGPVVFDLMTDGHLLVTGWAGTGKSTFVRTLAHTLSNDPADVVVDLVDFAQIDTPITTELPEVTGTRPATIDQVHQLITDASDDMRARYSALQQGSDLASPARVLILDSIDLPAATALVGEPSHARTPLRKILDLGRAVDIYVVVTGIELPRAYFLDNHSFRSALYFEEPGRAWFTGSNDQIQLVRVPARPDGL